MYPSQTKPLQWIDRLLQRGSEEQSYCMHMAKIFEEAAGILPRSWECKQCHQHVGEDHTVAYHLIDGVLYGWCEPCFSLQSAANKTDATHA